jgi:hypothetical protein
MPAEVKRKTHAPESSFVSLLSGWAQQGVNSFFATQRILLDLAIRQNASVMNLLRERLSDTRHSPTVLLTEMADEGVSTFIEAQKVLLELARQQSGIVTTGVKERAGESVAAVATTDLVRRSIETFIDMQLEFLKIAGKHSHSWLEAAKVGKTPQADSVVAVAQESMENFVRAQKRFIDVVADETAKATGAKHVPAKKMKKTDVARLARQATDSFLDAQKKLFDLAGKQVNTNLKVADRALEAVRPFPFLPIGDLTREGVKSFVEAQKALMEMWKSQNGHKHEAGKEHHPKRPVHRAKPAAAAVA